MQQLAEKIVAIVSDYHNYNGFQFTPERVLAWVNQFDENDQQFLLEELLHLLNHGIYISEVKARQLLIGRIENLSHVFNFDSPINFLENTEFIAIQPKGKSQDVLLGILREEIAKKYDFQWEQCGAKSTKYCVYLDDILATGGTVLKDCKSWLENKGADGTTNLTQILNKDKTLIISLFCEHNWANVKWKLKLALGNDSLLKLIRIYNDCEIQNHPKFLNQRFNLVYPTNENSTIVSTYLQNLKANNYEDVAFRKNDQPEVERLFSSPDNRNRFESIITHKGIELLGRAATLKPNHRPLGATFPSYKTLGTGTLFFTWRNVSNTSPIVFWWEAGSWYPLFPLYKRGIGNITFGT
jgi:hypothetical protein